MDTPDAERLMAGAMSGTSADGVDVALVRVAGRGLDMTARLVRHHHRAYPPELRNEIFAFRGGDASANLARLAQLGREISLTYATAVNEALVMEQLSGADLAAVAAHGQTLYHAPPNTIQWFDPSLVAAHVGCPVVSDFRRADLAAGGQGAPLVPFADYILFRHPTKTRVLLNLGGIANLTYLPAGGGIDSLLAFDTGPGNCVMDHLVKRMHPAGEGYDAGGRIASAGHVRREILSLVMRDPYFAQRPPKSTDGPAMIAVFERVSRPMMEPRPIYADWKAEDLVATACEVTAETITSAILNLPQQPDEVIASGGGTLNAKLMDALDGWLTSELDLKPQIERWVRTTDALGVPSQAKEAIAFALLGAATLDGVPSNVPSCTGAARAVVLGSITPKP